MSMARQPSMPLTILTLLSVILVCSERHGRVYKPYGIKMCKALTQDTSDTFHYVQEDLSCHRVPTNTSQTSVNISHETSLLDKRKTNLTIGHSFQRGMEDNTDGEDMVPDRQHIVRSKDATVLDEHARLVMYKTHITLHEACRQGKLDMVKWILTQSQADINSRDGSRKTPVMSAVMKGHLAVFNYLDVKGCDLSLVDGKRNTVLHYACKGGNVDIVRKLLDDKNFAKDTQNNKRRRPIMWAAWAGRLEVFKLLVRKGCDLTTGKNPNNNMLHLACIGGHLDMTRYILSQNICNIDSKGFLRRTAVMRVAAAGRKELFELLVEKGCSLKGMDKVKNNILHLACMGGNFDIVQYILSINICSMDSRGQLERTPVITAVVKHHMRLVKLLVDRGCSLTAQDKNGYSILHAACASGDIGIVKYLMTLQSVKGMAMSVDKNDLKPVQVAEKKGHKAIVAFLKKPTLSTFHSK